MSSKLKELITKYPVVTVTGPRQSGKTTLVKHVFPDRSYVSLEDPDIREFALTDPRGFLSTYPEGVILDEIQRVPALFSYIQTWVDTLAKEGIFVLTGSHNLAVMEGITQSLAGRVALLDLLPLSFSELSKAKQAPKTLQDLLFTGLYPRIYDKGLSPSEWYANYVNTYIERDVLMVTKVTDLARFQRFIKMCAARSGHILNLSSLGDDCGITHNTAKAWLSILQAGFIVFLLYPHHKNFNKRLIKSPKLYFYDPGLLCYLLGLNSPDSLTMHSFRGPIFETWVVSELLKGRFNLGLRENLYFWRDHVGHEVDCIIEHGETLIPLEIKSGETVTRDFFKGLDYWYHVSGISPKGGYIIYGGDGDQRRKGSSVMG